MAANPSPSLKGSGGTLTFDFQGLSASIEVGGNHQILAPVVMNDDTEIDIAPDSNAPVGSLTVADGITVAAGKTLSLHMPRAPSQSPSSVVELLDIEQGTVSIIPNGTSAGKDSRRGTANHPERHRIESDGQRYLD